MINTRRIVLLVAVCGLPLLSLLKISSASLRVSAALMFVLLGFFFFTAKHAPKFKGSVPSYVKILCLDKKYGYVGAIIATLSLGLAIICLSFLLAVLVYLDIE